MDQQKTNNQENLLTRVYKNLFFNKKDEKTAEEELKISKVLDKKGGIFNVSTSTVFNFDGKDNVFAMPKEKTIFDRKFEPSITNKQPISGNFSFKDLKMNIEELPSNLGNNFDQTC